MLLQSARVALRDKGKILDKLNNNFRCYNFSYKKDSKFPVLAYQSKWSNN
jgi:hypothetical protein